MDRDKIFAKDVTNKGFISKTFKLNKKNSIEKCTEDINPHVSRGWPIGTCKDAHHLYVLEKCKSTTMRYNIKLVRNVIFKKSANKFWRGSGGKGTLFTLLVVM